MSEIRADKLHNASGDNDSGIDLSTNDQVIIKTADTTAMTIDSSQGTTLAGKIDVSSGTIKLDGNYPTGTENVALGDQALDDGSLSGAYNTAIGHKALTANTSGASNTSVGRTSLVSNATGSNNTAVGMDSLANVTGSDNTAIGKDAGKQITSGQKNTVIGGYDGNQGGLDIRTENNFIVLSDGDGNPRLILDSSGELMINKTAALFANTGLDFRVPENELRITTDGAPSLSLNRLNSDGTLMQFAQGSTIEGTISISGTTTSYNGGHLSRWSQLIDNTRDNTLVKGTVMTNLDQMAEWTTDGVTEDNEQLNCMAVSSVEGDANVAGVFVNWDDDDDIYTNDMNIAMTGDMVIRIAQGTTVSRGDLLMSAGDGTAKPQGDDIVRSKTIAKVTSTNVSHTYDDGSYLVPCVLMAC